jgi:hypothetical protein
LFSESFSADSVIVPFFHDWVLSRKYGNVTVVERQ